MLSGQSKIDPNIVMLSDMSLNLLINSYINNNITDLATKEQYQQQIDTITNNTEQIFQKLSQNVSINNTIILGGEYIGGEISYSNSEMNSVAQSVGLSTLNLTSLLQAVGKNLIVQKIDLNQYLNLSNLNKTHLQPFCLFKLFRP